MWISKSAWLALEDKQASLDATTTELTIARERSSRLEVENARLRADLDWFKLRLNAVEKERQMLMLDRLGIKIPVPEFVAAQDLPDELDAVNAMPDFSLIGGDAPPTFNPAQELGPDYSGLPVRKDN